MTGALRFGKSALPGALLIQSLLMSSAFGDPFKPQWAPWFADPLIWQYTAQAVGIWYTPWCGCQTDHWWGLAAGAALAPTDTVEVQAQLSVAKHTGTSLYWDTAQVCGRYLFLSDLAGDPVSLSTGLTVTFGSNDARRSVAEFVPSNANGELSVAMGKEWARCEEWLVRVWALGAGGLANQGRPWLRGSVHLDVQPWAGFALYSSVGGIASFGSQRCWGPVFPGYAEVRARWLDLQLAAAYSSQTWGTWGLEYRTRLQSTRAPYPWRLGGLYITYETSF